MLDPGGILGLVHANVTVAVLKRLQNLRVPAQYGQGVDHLVVEIHLPALAQGLVVGAEKGREVHALRLHRRQFLPGEHLVFGVGDGGFQGPDSALRGKVPALGAVELGHQGALFPAVLQHRKGGAAESPLIEADDPAAHAVDGAKFQLPGFLLPEQGGKAGGHVPGGGHRIGHGEDALRGDARYKPHIAQPRHQHGGFAAAGYRQQQHRPLHRLDRRLLLGIQIGGKLCLELGKIHVILRNVP